MWQDNPFEDAEQWIEFELNRYLSLSHVERPDYGCVLPALASEVARSDLQLKQTYQAELMRGQQIFKHHLGSEEKAWAVLCQLIGAIIMARSIADENLKQTILTSSKALILSCLKSVA